MGCFRGVHCVFQEGSRGVSGVFVGCSWSVSGVFMGCFRGVHWVLQGCSLGVSGVFIGCLLRRRGKMSSGSKIDLSSYWDDNVTLSYINGHIDIQKVSRLVYNTLRYSVLSV